MAKHIQVIINPAAGQPEPILPVLNTVFQEAGVEWEVAVTQELGDGTRLAEEAVRAGADVVAAYGGDGTVMEVVNGLIGSDVTLGILPGGTGNVLSVELEIPQTLEEAAKLICAAEPAIRRLDLGKCGERYFLLRLSTGFSARQIGMASREMRDQYGRLAYLIAALRALPAAKPIHFRLTLDDEQESFEGMTCIVANAGSVGISGISLASKIRIDDGMLDLLAVQDLNLEALSSLAASIADLPSEATDLNHWQARRITIDCDPAQPVVADGEDVGTTPVTVEVVPQAIPVIVPVREA
ncbi:MAG: diacylglycerol kinase family lipid kinase [Anaerolineae bacterium]|nr:diacylglycerol kinase family lipid kinase [Anaerolineae bacterium]